MALRGALAFSGHAIENGCMRALSIVMLLAACGPGLGGASEYHNPKSREAAADLAGASQRRDVSAVRAMLRDSTTVGGLWFEDAACMAKFAFPSEVKGPALDELARCLTTLGLQQSERGDSLPDVIVLTYGPGVEVEARLVETDDGPWLAWIGYVARRDVKDALPTISAAALEELRTGGDRHAPLAGPGAFDELAIMQCAYAWMKVCIDGSGAVTGAHVREATSPHAARVFGDAIKTWQFKPFLLGNQPTPVCAMVRMVYPTDKTPPEEMLPLPVPETPGVHNVPNKVLGTRIAGDTAIAPDAKERTALAKAHIRKLIAALHWCVDESGHVTHVTLLRSSGLPRYDQRLVAAAREWAFKPYLDEGKPIGVCSSTHFIYKQR